MKYWSFLLFVLLSCASYRITYIPSTEESSEEYASLYHPGTEDQSPEKPPVEENEKGIIKKLLEGVNLLDGQKATMTVRDQQFMADCIGTVRAVYYYAGIDLAAEFNKYEGNGVTRLYQALDARGLIYTTRHPRAGDIIFWDNTWDQNGDKVWNDPLTHVGMITAVSPSGQLEYFHLDYIKGNTVARMNLMEPDIYYKVEKGEVVYYNSPMRMKEAGKPHPPRWLSSHLVRAFGRGYLYRN